MPLLEGMKIGLTFGMEPPIHLGYATRCLSRHSAFQNQARPHADSSSELANEKGPFLHFHILTIHHRLLQVLNFTRAQGPLFSLLLRVLL